MGVSFKTEGHPRWFEVTLSQVITLRGEEGVHSKAKIQRELTPDALLTFLPRSSQSSLGNSLTASLLY